MTLITASESVRHLWTVRILSQRLLILDCLHVFYSVFAVNVLFVKKVEGVKCVHYFGYVSRVLFNTFSGLLLLLSFTSLFGFLCSSNNF